MEKKGSTHVKFSFRPFLVCVCVYGVGSANRCFSLSLFPLSAYWFTPSLLTRGEKEEEKEEEEEEEEE